MHAEKHKRQGAPNNPEAFWSRCSLLAYINPSHTEYENLASERVKHDAMTNIPQLLLTLNTQLIFLT